MNISIWNTLVYSVDERSLDWTGKICHPQFGGSHMDCVRVFCSCHPAEGDLLAEG